MQSFSFKLPTGTDFEALLQPPVCSMVLCGCLESCLQKIWMLAMLPSHSIHKLLYLRTNEDPFFHIWNGNVWKSLMQIPKLLYFCSWSSKKSFIPSLMWRGGRNAFCGTTSGSFAVLFQLEENALSETILSQCSHYFLCDWSIHISSNTTVCN